jgi:hypothetical protein
VRDVALQLLSQIKSKYPQTVMADDLAAEKTPGFKVGEKKTLDEYPKLGKS